MKTLTEFFGPQLKNALKTRAELVAAGKTPEELPAAMGEALKLEGDKLKYFLNALELSEKKAEGLKRVIVAQAAENEKAPYGAIEKEGQHYTLEFFPTAPQAQRHQREDDRGGRGGKGGRGDKRGGKGGRGGERGPRGPGGDRGPRGPRPEGVIITTGAAGAEGQAPGAGGEKRPPRGPRPPRAPRPPREPRAPREVAPNPNPGGPRPQIIIPGKTKPAETTAAAPASTPAESAPAPKPEETT